jgi:16S rRNA (cytidine1402-2'-O)-methyltransferase
MPALVYLIPTVLYEGQTDCLPAYITDAIRKCDAFFVESERTARRFVKLLWKEIVIDQYPWHNIQEVTDETRKAFIDLLHAGKTIGIISEAGCPGVADPGQQLVQLAQKARVIVKPLVGPNSILLALMASGMNGQQFQFHGYLPIDAAQRMKSIKTLEAESRRTGSTQIFIETPYRNNQLLETLVKTCHPQTLICVAADLTAPTEMVRTQTAQQWKQEMPQLHKRPAIFLLSSQN